MHVILAYFSGVEFALLDDEQLMEKAMHDAVAAADFQLLHSHLHHFDPHGITGIAVVGESHIAIHTWPEHGKFFLDIASCTTMQAARKALNAVRALFPNAIVEAHESTGPVNNGNTETPAA